LQDSIRSMAKQEGSKRLNQDIGLLVAQTLVDLYGADRVLTLRAEDGRTVSTRRNTRPDLPWVERYTPHRVLPPRGARRDRVVLDIVTVRKLVHGDRDAIDLDALAAHRDNHPISIADGALTELARGLGEGRLPMDRWAESARELNEVLDPDLPVCPGGFELAAIAGLRPFHGVDFEGTRTYYRETWRYLCSRRRPEDLREPGHYDGPDGKRYPLRLYPLHIEPVFAYAGRRWEEWMRDAARELAALRKDSELEDEELRRLIRLHLRMNMSAEGLDKIDLAVRVVALRTAQVSRGGEDQAGEGKEGVDVDLLFATALPAVICTQDEVLLDLARKTRSGDAWRVMDPPALLTWLGRDDQPEGPSQPAEEQAEPGLDPAEQQAAWEAWVEGGPQGPIDDGAAGWP
ncbi:MAG TPA: hypothetical protein VLS89_07140, partial [Candidatus Nanopelagicales bacterium]|nr:hypothetical protein [Candidatus Nanopelagicales bacterium]